MKVQRCIAVGLLVVTFASSASSAPSTATATDDKAVAETLFHAGRALMDEGRYEEACVKLAESYRLDPTGGTVLALAVCHEKTGKIASAWGEYRQALADAKKAGRSDRAEFAAKQIALLEPELPFLRIAVPPSVRVAGLEVLRNGRLLTEGAWDTELPIDPGAVEIVARAPGRREARIALEIARKEHRTVTLSPLEVATTTAAAAEGGWSSTRTVGASLFLVGLASAGVTTYFALSAHAEKKRSDESCPVVFGERRCDETGVSAMSAARRDAWLANGFGALALVGLGVGTYLFVVGGRPHDATSGHAIRLHIAPTAFGVAGVLGGTF